MEVLNSLPILSVILAIRNEEKYIENTTYDLFTQNFNYEEVEILIADGVSDDDTVEIVKRVLVNFPNINVKLFSNLLQYQYSGVNRLICRSKGKYLLIVDGHSHFPPDFFESNISALKKYHADIVGGILITKGASGGFAKAIPACLSTWFGVGRARFRIHGQSGKSDGAAFPCIRREVFGRIGLFREEQRSNADIDLFRRAQKAGYKIILDKNIRSEYFARASLKELAKQMHRNAKWLPAQLNAIKIRHIVPFAFILATITLPVIALTVHFFWTMWLLMVISYLGLAVISAITYKRAKLKPINRLKMVLCYFVMHFSYGIGWICGFFSKEVLKAIRLKKNPPKRLNDKLETELIEIN